MGWLALSPTLRCKGVGFLQNAERRSLMSLEKTQVVNAQLVILQTAKPKKPHFQWLCDLNVDLTFIFLTFVSQEVQASGGSHVSSPVSSKGWVNALVFPPMGILEVPFILNQQNLGKSNNFEVPTLLSKLVTKVLMASELGKLDASRQCVLFS